MKKLLLNIDRFGILITPDSDEKFNPLSDPREWDPEDWYYYTLNRGKFSVENDQEVQIRIADIDEFKNYSFAEFSRPDGYRYPCWSDKPISIDDSRDIKGKLLGIKAVDCFKGLELSKRKIKFTYVGPDAKRNSEILYFAYDLYLKNSRTLNHMYIGPVITNNGGIGGDP